ncbi:MAG: DUF126 domain-containing protein [Actinomycetota bacterium]|nr:DUF126 domain-containing protein [Actinomycetota bacterium]
MNPPGGEPPQGPAAGIAVSVLTVAGKTLCPGEASGELLRLDEPLSLWGGTDLRTGVITDIHHPQHGTAITGRVLLTDASRGSSSSSSVLAEQIRAGAAPAAIILTTRDAILTLGAIAAAELYGILMPIVLIDGGDAAVLRGVGPGTITVTAVRGTAAITFGASGHPNTSDLSNRGTA